MSDDKINKEIYPPAKEFLHHLTIKHPEELSRRADQDLAGFWEEQARQFEWFSPWKQVLDDSNKPFFKWFVGATTNIAYNCLDRHVSTWRRNKLALVWEG